MNDEELASVPRYPSQAMIEAAQRVAPKRDGQPMSEKSIRAIWSAMVAVGRTYDDIPL